ncbi:SRPBCC family protein [Peribacillus sp. FSL R5-0717]|uniref:SRPBCC family protein n=1 Tax=Peribacillus sp. FSL R5-0717 TaxID=2975308 RepID=UPI0030FAFA5C
MPRIKNSILIQENIEKVFNITNDIKNWNLLFNDYHESRILSSEKEGRFTKIVFELSNSDSTWKSYRLLDHKEYTAIAQRIEPMFPFLYMHLTWKYERHPEGTLMTWIQDFELDSNFKEPLDKVVQRMDRHTKENQEKIKNIIEENIGLLVK